MGCGKCERVSPPSNPTFVIVFPRRTSMLTCDFLVQGRQGFMGG